MRKHRRRLGNFPKLSIQIFYRIRRVNHTANRFGIIEEWRQVCPPILPALQIRLVLQPAFHHFDESLHASFLGRRGINHLKFSTESFLVLVRDKLNRVPDLMRDADLDFSFREDCINGFRESF